MIAKRNEREYYECMYKVIIAKANEAEYNEYFYEVTTISPG